MSTPAIVIGPDVIPVRPDEAHEYVIDTAAVARGYGITSELVRRHKSDHADELVEGKHWITVSNPHANPRGGVPHSSTFWTKRGVVRLGFFIRSKRAKIFRDLAEDLVIRATTPEPTMSYPEALRRLADAVERGDKTADALSIIAPRHGFGSISERTGEPRTRLIPAHYRSGLSADEATRRFVQFQSEFIDLLLSR